MKQITDNKNLELIKFLKSISTFKNLQNEEIQFLIKSIFRRYIKSNEYVFSKKEKGQILYIVEKGKLALELINKPDVCFYSGDVFGEIAIINNSFRTGSIKAVENSSLLCLDRNDLFDEKKLPAKTSLKIFIELAKIITSYLSSHDNTTTQALINYGENENVEFKTTLRWKIHTKKFDKEIEHAVLKTVAAFLNSKGGTLIIGVDDNKNILGLKYDKFPSDDRTLLHFTSLVKEKIGMHHISFIYSNIEEIEEKKVIRIDIKPSSIPAYLSHNNDEIFYIRTGPSTSQLRVSEIYYYIQTRFYKSQAHIKKNNLGFK
ncbi:MAG: putative DNA binding domain-containing protein [Bacteroidales bacterium]|nr:putative DNA binding domain-containing protein [Bacteroidales bacterium]